MDFFVAFVITVGAALLLILWSLSPRGYPIASRFAAGYGAYLATSTACTILLLGVSLIFWPDREILRVFIMSALGLLVAMPLSHYLGYKAERRNTTRY